MTFCLDTDVNEFLVRQMSPVFSSSDIELWQAAVGAANGNHACKDWSRALPYFQLAVSGVRKYYQQYCGYLGSTLEKYSECLFLSGHTEQVGTSSDPREVLSSIQARTTIQEAERIMRIIPGKENYYYKKHFLPKYKKIQGTAVTKQ